MQYKQETEKIAMMNSSCMVVPKPLSLVEDCEVQRTRKILVIILVVCLGLYVALLVGAVFRYELTAEMKVTQRMTQAGEAIIPILFYGFGIFVARRYSAIGLRVFAWLNIIELVLMGIGIVILIVAMIIGFTVISLTDGDAQMKGAVAGVTTGIFIFILLICIAAFVLSMIIVKLTFKLARAIDANQRLIIEQA